MSILQFRVIKTNVIHKFKPSNSVKLSNTMDNRVRNPTPLLMISLRISTGKTLSEHCIQP